MTNVEGNIGLKGALVRQAGRSLELRTVDPITKTEFWRYDESADEKARYPEFKRSIQREATIQASRMSQKLADFFALPSVYWQNSIPPVYVSNTIAGGTASHHGSSNSIYFPIKYAFPLHMGQTNYLRETQFYPTLAHEVGHYIQSAALAKGDVSKFESFYWKYEKIGFEFFAAICERVICEEMNIDVKQRSRSDFGPTDEHIGIALADEQYETIKALSPQERQKLALDFDLLLRYVDPQTIIDRKVAIEEAWRRDRERREDERRRRRK